MLFVADARTGGEVDKKKKKKIDIDIKEVGH